MRSIPVRAWMLVIFSSCLQILCFPISGQIQAWREGICWFALVPLFLALFGRNVASRPHTKMQGFLLGYVGGITWYAGNCYWIYQTMYLYGGLPKPVALLILLLFALYLGLYHALFGWLIVFLRRSSFGVTGAFLLSPFLWVSVELARSRITGFPWDLLGNSVVDHAWITRLAPVGGVMAISFVIAAVNAALALSALRTKRSWLVLTSVSILVAVVIQIAGPRQGRESLSLQNGPEMAVMMQENLSVGVAAKEERPLTREEELQQFSAWSLHPKISKQHKDGFPSEAGRIFKSTLIIWPEAPSHFLTSDQGFLSGIGKLARGANAPVIAGSIGVVFDKKPARGYYEYDSAALFDRSGEYQGRYDKIHLVPWGEYVPYKEFFSFAQKLTAGTGDMDPGRDRTVFKTAGHIYGVFVCYESIFGDEVRQFVKNGAEVLVNISDDGWYGDTGAPWQHLNMARMRAIENHRWVLRSTNTGLTTAIDPYGRYTETARHVRVAYALPFSFMTGQTLYTRYGDWFAYLCALVSVAALGVGLARRTGPWDELKSNYVE